MGITPACAGKTLMLTAVMRRVKDHPRMRGEDDVEVWYLRCHLGSPPHARGRLCTAVIIFHAPSDHPRMRGEDS